MRKELTLQIPVTAPAEISAQEVIEMTKTILALYEERYDLKQVEYGTPRSSPKNRLPMFWPTSSNVPRAVASKTRTPESN